MKNKHLIMILVAAVLLVFAIFPGFMRPAESDRPLLSVVPTDTGTEIIEIESDLQCTTTQDCINQVLEEDSEAGITTSDVTCRTGKCVFIVEPIEVPQ